MYNQSMVAETVEVVEAQPVREVIGKDDKGRDLVMYGGETCRVCSNGALQRVRDGVMVRPPTVPLEPIRDTERANQLNWQRWHGSRQEAVRKAVERASGNAVPDIDMADAYIMGDLVETIALNVDVRADHRVKALQMVYEQSGMDGRAPKQAQSGPDGGVTLTISADAASKMMEKLLGMAEQRGLLGE